MSCWLVWLIFSGGLMMVKLVLVVLNSKVLFELIV